MRMRVRIGILALGAVAALLLSSCQTDRNGGIILGTPQPTMPVSGSVNIINKEGIAQNVSMASTGELQVHGTTLLETIGTHGSYDGRVAYSLNIMGRRTTWANTTGLNDIKSFDTSVDNVPVMDGTEALEIVSSSANDTLAGTGAQKVVVVYLDTTGAIVESAPIDLNGTTPVSVAWTAAAIEWMEVSQVGSGTVSAGNILLRRVTVGTGYEQIDVGGNKSMSARFTVPTGYTGYLISWSGNCIAGTTQNIDIRLRSQSDSLARTAVTPFRFEDSMYLLSGGAHMMLAVPFLHVHEGAMVKVSGISSANNNRADVSFIVALIAN